MTTNQVLIGVGLILLLAVGSQVLASRLKIPALIILLPAGFTAGGGIVFAIGLFFFALHLSWQIVRLDIADPDNCLAVFKSDRDAGLILFAGIALQGWAG